MLAASSSALAQAPAPGQSGGSVFYQNTGTAISMGAIEKGSGALIQGAPYSATITNESVQTLPDGSHITQTSTGTVARDSQGRTRQDAPLPPIGNLSAANAPHIVFIQDPVAQTSCTLNLTDKTAQQMPAFPAATGASGTVAAPGTAIVAMKMGSDTAVVPPLPAPGMFIQRSFAASDPSQVATEDLGSQTMEGVLVTGTRTTRVIPEGQIGNDAPISIVTEVWVSPDLKTIVYSKRSDPRMGVQTFELKNIVRAEPDPSLFTVPADFKVMDGPQPIMYRTSQ
jgi:hypothetical protein